MVLLKGLAMPGYGAPFTRHKNSRNCPCVHGLLGALERGLSGISLETLKKICETLQVSSDTILFTETIQADMAVEKLTNKFLNMTPEQLRIMEAITNAFLQASNK